MLVRDAWWWSLVLATCFVLRVQAEILTPPYFNLAEGRKITASATCGQDTEGPELYCKLVGANAENDINVNVIQGQFCDVCDPTRPDKWHPPENAVNGMETWWQSPPLSRGMKYNEVNLTIDFGQEFHVAYVYIRMGNSPRPGLWVLEKSADYGLTYTPWQYFSDSPDDCATYFGKETLEPITRDDSVICTTDYSKIVPLEGGEIPISILNNRPSANYYFNSTTLQEWTRATNVRFRMLRTKNLLGHLMSVARQDPTVTRRYFYSIKDISIGGRCMCNGHADTCDIQDASENNILVCRCQHNTCGAKCESCCAGFEQKAWRISKTAQPFACEPCNCFSHSYECEYDQDVDAKHLSLDIHGNYEGGGVCQNCQHNTQGINCNKCKNGFYRPANKYWNETDVCKPCECDSFFSTGNCEELTGRCECKPEFTSPNCDSCSFGYYGYPYCKACECHLNGTEDFQCESDNGVCSCKFNYGGTFCNHCAEGYYNFPACEACECNSLGSLSTNCNQETGNCSCKNNYGGRTCDRCENGYYGYPRCSYCNCDVRGTKAGVCEKETGQCLCREGYGGERCDQCIPGFYGYPECQPCNCSAVGAASSVCNSDGKCSCLHNFAGRTCEQCSVGYYKYPECLACNCDGNGAIGISCDGEGTCQCHRNFDGLHCDQCKEGFYNFPDCEECNCNPAGVVEEFAGCGSVPAGELCKCKDRVQGRICNKCKPLFWNLSPANPDGCEECRCHLPGSSSGIGVCDSVSGQCACKPSVGSKDCSECIDGTYSLQEDNLFGCTDCGCDIGGSLNSVCDKRTGQCQCQPRVTGRTCREPLQAHYFPTLYHYQYEVEDGHTPAFTPVRYAYEEDVFPNYSWKGYAVFSQLQNEVLQDVYIQKPSLYRMVLRYVNKNPETVEGTVSIMPENPHDIEQKLKVQFRNSSKPALVTVSSQPGNVPSPLVMNPGRWVISIKSMKNLLVDYFVLLPEHFYEATLLNQRIDTPCKIGDAGLCRLYSYPHASNFDKVLGNGGFIVSGRSYLDSLQEYLPPTEQTSDIHVTRVPAINAAQPEITYNLTVSKPGPYVILINYITPLEDTKTYTITVEGTTDRTNSTDYAVLNSCPYTTVCRSVVTSPKSVVSVYQIDSNIISLKLIGNDSNVGVHSIVAVPYDEWSLNYIQPKAICMQKDGRCVQSLYPNAPDSKKVQFELGNEERVAELRPNMIYDNASHLILLDEEDNMVDVKSKVPHPGNYVFVVQYYQPDYPEFELDALLQNGAFYESKLKVPHCPSNSGCRSVVTQLDGSIEFTLTENVMLTLKTGGAKKNKVWLDYILVIPAESYVDSILDENTLDRTGEFISTCGGNHFNIDTSIEGFCRDSVYSLTADYNHGALSCNCDYDGSLSFECDKFGGQCECKPNVIGRKCEACKTGYFGFPDCKPCNCPATALCEDSTGKCICPPRVTGERCNQCEPLTYGFDSIIGCEECKCNPLGVQGSLQCDLFNGSCPCKHNIVGRTCGQCIPGYYLFPYCDQCECDLRGTKLDICDQETAECFCKDNVNGPACDLCQDGTFNLQESNENGCTDCFCFGKTKRCSSSNLIRIVTSSMHDWTLAAVNDTTAKLHVEPLDVTPQLARENEIGVDLSQVDAVKSAKIVYFSAPAEYLGKKLTAYGGFLNYTIFYTIGHSGRAVPGSDVILVGENTFLSYSSVEQPAAVQEYQSGVEIVEANFALPSGAPASRDHVMLVLQNVTAIYVRAMYWNSSITTRLQDVHMDDAVSYRDHRGATLGEYVTYATSVESCQCPANYRGLSCEDCSPGYYRISNGPHGGYCVPCQCNGHSDKCDVNTGVCIDCKHNTIGDHCEMCEIGYHGNAQQGTARDCLICACPLPIPSNNFANSCEVSNDGNKISCNCNEGYYGALCSSCAAGYFGRPDVPGDYCKPCQCSGNINPDEPESCDSVSGECLRCLNNTHGEACAYCAPGYFGDAVVLKDCQTCVCDELGTERCNSQTGQCVCKPNVIGEKCDRCEIEHYGFSSGDGCLPCECSTASDSMQCDDGSGQCRCKPGVTGRACDRCQSGFWNLNDNGCINCGCNSELSRGIGCNAQTGQCECLPGVEGEQCDRCPYRWVFVPDVGCHECDSCSHDLLDDTDELRNFIDPYITEFDAVDSGYFTSRRLGHLNDTLNQLRPRVNLLDPTVFNLVPIIQELEGLEQDSKNGNRKGGYAVDNSKVLVVDADNVFKEAKDALEAVKKTSALVRRTVNDVVQLGITFGAGEGPKLEMALQEAEQLLDEINMYNLTDREDEANTAKNKADTLLDELKDFRLPVVTAGKEYMTLLGNVNDFNNKLDDLTNYTQYAINKANEAEAFNAQQGKDKVNKKINNIQKSADDAEQELKDARILLANATRNFKNASGMFLHLNEDQENANLYNELNNTLFNNEKEFDEAKTLLNDASDHAEKLSRKAEELDHLLTETRNLTDKATRAAKAYAEILNAVEGAQNDSEQALQATQNSTDLLENLRENALDLDRKSNDLLDDAMNQLDSSLEELKPQIQESKEELADVESANKNNMGGLDRIEKFINRTPLKVSDALSSAAMDNATVANEKAKEALNTVANFVDQVPGDVDQAKLLPKSFDDTRRFMKQTAAQLENIEAILPNISSLIEELRPKQAVLQNSMGDIENKIKKLNEQIAFARGLANRIKVGLTFYPNTSLELRNPPNLPDQSTSTHISGYFKTAKPDGLVWYLGNEEGTKLRRTKTDDFMSLEIENGYPTLTVEIGNGPERIINSKYVADNNWYQFVIDRVGHNAKLTIREELSDGHQQLHTTEQTLKGTNSIFNLDQDQSKLFVGSIPNNFKAQEYVEQNSFEGEMEEFIIGENPISFWNFNDGDENGNGAVQRDKLRVGKPTGYRFNGNGYVILDARTYSLKQRTSIGLSFKTFANSGLLFLAGKGKTFMALEIRNGKVLFQYNLGSGTATYATPATYNDGKWHTLEAIRDGANGKFIVDGEEIASKPAKVSGTHIDAPEHIFIGGYPQEHSFIDVTNTDFDGCIDNVLIKGNPVVISDHLKAYGITPGCPLKFSRLVSFASKPSGYVRYPNATSANNFQVSLKFKTQTRDGLIFYGTDRDQSNGMSLQLVNGDLVLVSQKQELRTSHSNYSDNEWHVVTAIHDSNGLRLDIDDYEDYSTDSPPPALHILYGDLYIGGVPHSYRPKKGSVITTEPFVGCIGDATLNRNVINFANSTDKMGEILGKCILDKETAGQDSDVHFVPSVAPGKDSDRDKGPVQQPDEEDTETSILTDLPKRGDGGVDSEDDDDGVEEETTTAKIATTTVATIKPKTEEPDEDIIRRPAPESVESCALPLEPEILPEDPDAGLRFGTEAGSRLEYPTGRGKTRKQFDFQLTFKTHTPNGLLMYASDESHNNFVAIYLQDGKIKFSFDCGTGPAVLGSNATYSDGAWHTVSVQRMENEGKLVIDDYVVTAGKSGGNSHKLELKPPYYVGGFPQDIRDEIFGNLHTAEPFNGCIKHFHMNSKLMENPRQFKVIQCSRNVESGVFFGTGGGYMRLIEGFRVGLEVDIKLEIKPRNLTGLILSVFGKRDYLILEMVDGVIKFSVDNGRGPIIAEFKPDKTHYFCDGRWHLIQAVKSRNIVTLSVDRTFTEPSVGRQGSTDTSGPLFLGGHRFINRIKGVSTRSPFVGCIRNVQKDNEPIEFKTEMATGAVTVGSCPTN